MDRTKLIGVLRGTPSLKYMVVNEITRKNNREEIENDHFMNGYEEEVRALVGWINFLANFGEFTIYIFFTIFKYTAI
jgi:hypothetical protein